MAKKSTHSSLYGVVGKVADNVATLSLEGSVLTHLRFLTGACPPLPPLFANDAVPVDPNAWL